MAIMLAGQGLERARQVASELEPERAPLRSLQRSLLRGREQAQVRGLLRLEERRLLRCKGRVQL